MICAAQATKCLIGLAKGLRNKFYQYSRSLPATIFEKFVEEKAIMREPLAELIDVIFDVSVNLINFELIKSSITGYIYYGFINFGGDKQQSKPKGPT
jgi:hypothetical protein